jgi:hypothetical protein
VTDDLRTIPPLLQAWAASGHCHRGVIVIDERTCRPQAAPPSPDGSAESGRRRLAVRFGRAGSADPLRRSMKDGSVSSSATRHDEHLQHHPNHQSRHFQKYIPRPINNIPTPPPKNPRHPMPKSNRRANAPHRSLTSESVAGRIPADTFPRNHGTNPAIFPISPINTTKPRRNPLASFPSPNPIPTPAPNDGIM